MCLCERYLSVYVSLHLVASCKVAAFLAVLTFDGFLCLLSAIRVVTMQVRALAGDARYAKLHELLTIFATQGLPEYQAFHAANGPLVASLGVDHEASVRAMRLLTLTSLAAASKGPLSYDAVAAAISVSPTLQWQ